MAISDLRGRNQQVVRQWQVLVLLRRQRCTLETIAQHCGVTTRTTRRDLAALEAVPFPIRCRRGDEIDGDEVIYYLGEVTEWPRNEIGPTRHLRMEARA